MLNDLLKEKVLINNKSLFKDITLLKSQAERCSNILLSLSKNPQALQDNFFEKIKIEDLIKLCFDKFNTDKVINIEFENINRNVTILYKDEINYALTILFKTQYNMQSKVFVKCKEFKRLSIKIQMTVRFFKRYS